MGQNVSRPQDEEPAPVSLVAEATDHDTAGPSTESSTTSPKRSRRSSMGQSLRTLIRSKSSNTLSSTASSSALQTDSPSSRKRWRASRRWSRTPDEFGLNEVPTHENADVLPVPEEDGAADDLDRPEQIEGPTDHIGISAPKMSSASTHSLADPAEEKEGQGCHDRHTTPSSPEQNTSTNIGTWMGGSGSLAQALGIPAEPTQDDEVVISPDVSDGDIPSDLTMTSSDPPLPISTVDPLPDPSTARSSPAPQENRAFPPPGTLVIVQGVVHTTDVSRSPSATPSPRPAPSTPGYSTPLSSEPGSAPRSRLSSLIRQTPSILSRPSSMFGDSPIAGDSMSEPTSVEDSVQGAEPQAERVFRAPVLSPSSIDVLGTLLRVAAAATASSLLNGQTENANLNPPANVPSAGLGNLSAFASGLGPVGQPVSPRGGRERMRNAWTGLRARLRRGPNAPEDSSIARPLSTHAHDGETPSSRIRTRPDGTPMDAREIMLAEMARAFNLGLGLSEEGGANANEDPTYIPVSHSPAVDGSRGASQSRHLSAYGHGIPGSEAASTGRPGLLEPPESPEGSFERFLVDLQADLRIALSGPGVFPAHSPVNGLPVSGPPSNTTPQMFSAESTAAGTTESDQDAVPPTFRATVTDEHNTESSLEQDTPDSEHGHNAINAANPETHVSGPLSPGDTANPAPPSNTTHRTEYRPGGGINWWRSYRFPAITTPQAHGLTPTDVQAPAPSSSSDPSSTPSALLNTPQGPSSPETVADDSNTVVPVIVVGLQSVNMDEHGAAATFGEHDHDDDDIFGNVNTAGDSQTDGTDVNIGGTWPADGEDDAIGFTHARPGTQPNRSWHSRAANALRNLRPGRRAPRSTENDGAGSRTFLIYVIGGYYPPNHGLITGADTLDSFEALWELADLLGQVKPQTVTKEAIDKSNLEIISPGTLEQYEREGKVASNCLDRCLICLDDYDAQDELRLLSCRHAFHKTCVDEWLTVGKNNCPACRTTGIPDASTTV
ncbi:hypothetical protein HWV62_19223 [Athelia sp. TMB]|nr:hypothetical protein HWV62_19223 [Athelia sp. TMB]